jgi:tetratricopeptide (TPR) repeat protein
MKSILLFLLMALLAFPMLAQDDDDEPLICDSFPSSPQEVRVSYYMGEGAGFLSARQYAAAIESYSCVTEQVNPNFVGAHVGRAIAYAARQEYDESIDDYTRAIELDGGLLAAYNNRGIVYAAQGEYEMALADFNLILGQNANYVAALNNRAIISAILGEFDSALTDLDQAINITGIDGVVAELSDPDRLPDAPIPDFNPAHAQSYALRGIIRSAQALDNYDSYLLLRGSQSDQRIQSAAGALESRFTFELRLDDGTWLLSADFSTAGEEIPQ